MASPRRVCHRDASSRKGQRPMSFGVESRETQMWMPTCHLRRNLNHDDTVWPHCFVCRSLHVATRGLRTGTGYIRGLPTEPWSTWTIRRAFQRFLSADCVADWPLSALERAATDIASAPAHHDSLWRQIPGYHGPDGHAFRAVMLVLNGPRPPGSILVDHRRYICHAQ